MSTSLMLSERPKRRPKVPGNLVYEELNGRPLYYAGYRDVLAGRKTPEEIMGSSDIQAIVVGAILGFIHANIDRKKYWITTNESGLHLKKGNNLSNDIAIFEKSDVPVLRGKYFTVPPKVVVEVDVKVELPADEFPAREADYVFEKSARLLDFGVQKVIWITTHTRKLFVATPNDPWTVQDWNRDVPVLDDCVLNLARLLEEEGIAWE
jgi:Uma2 family endonuclease